MKYLSKIYISVIFFLLYAPILVMIVFSFNSSDSLSVMNGFSFKNYQEVFRNSEVIGAFKNTLILAVSTAAISGVLGTAAAVGISRMRSKYLRTSILSITNIPMMNPDIVTGVSLMLLFVSTGAIIGLQTTLSFWTLLIAHVTFSLPYVILSVLPKIKQMDKHLTEAAMDLGCTPLMAFFKVELPCIMPGVVSGITMVFVPSVSTFYISQKLGGGSFDLIGDVIERQFQQSYNYNLGASLSLVLMVLILICMAVMNRFSGDEEGMVI